MELINILFINVDKDFSWIADCSLVVIKARCESDTKTGDTIPSSVNDIVVVIYRLV